MTDFPTDIPTPKKKRHWLLRSLFYLVSLGFTCAVIGMLGGMIVFYHYSEDLPDSSSLEDYQPAGMTRLYSADEMLIAEYAKQRRIFVPIEEIPPKVVQAFVAAEDQNFYTHRGIDPTGIMRAFLKNVRKYSGEDTELVGGSTITQQVVKNFLLTREKSFERKIKEAILSLRITQNYSKDRILELYLNEIYLGMGSYGVAAASIEFFGKPLAQLDTEEAALLAAMPKAPSSYDPRRNPDKAHRRRDYVINRMHADGYINDAERERALEAPMEVLEDSAVQVAEAPYFAEEVRRALLADYGQDTVYKGNLFVKTTVDLSVQALLDTSLRDALVAYDRRHGYRGALAHVDTMEGWEEALTALTNKTSLIGEQQLAIVSDMSAQQATLRMHDMQDGTPYIPLSAMTWARPVRASGAVGAAPKKPSDILSVGDVVLVAPLEQDAAWALQQIPAANGALVAMRPATGEVIAMSGGYSFKNSEFNRATQAMRQPGSSMKPFVYMAALERGFTPSSIVADSPISISQGAGKPMWEPKNYGGDYLGPATLRTGLEKSRNVMTVRLAQMVGIPKILALTKRFGIYTDPPRNYSVTLGAYETTVMRIVTAYSMLVNGGLKVSPVMIKRIDDRTGTTIYRADGRTCGGCIVASGNVTVSNAEVPELIDERERIADARIAYQMVSLLQGVVQRGTAVRAKSLGMPMGGKTGTTNDSRDAWFVGVTSDLVVGGYIGFDTPKTLGKRETGGRVALPAVTKFLKGFYADEHPKQFVSPSGIMTLNVDRYTGVPPLPWQEGGALIAENFVTGDDIFVPDSEAQFHAEPIRQDMPTAQFVDYDYGNQLYRTNGQVPGPAPSTTGSYQRSRDVYVPGYTTRSQPSAPMSTAPVNLPAGAKPAYQPIPQVPQTTAAQPRSVPPAPRRRSINESGYPQSRRQMIRRGSSASGTGGLY